LTSTSDLETLIAFQISALTRRQLAMTALAPPAVPVTRSWLRSAPFALAGALFVAYPVLRPWGDAAPATAGAAFAAPGWLAGHLSAAAAFVLVGFGLWAMGRPTRRATGLWWAGASLTLLYYGAETFALHALGAQVHDPAVLAALTEAIRMGPTQITVFGLGLVLMGAAAVVLAVRLRAVAVPFALGMVLFLPQFFAGPELRIAHGVLLGAGCLLLALRR
jgi:hypothetical protein